MSAKNKTFVYIIKAGSGYKSPIKVGVTDNVHKRMKQLQTGNPKELMLVMRFECNDRRHAFTLEKTIHETLEGRRLCGEWFEVTKSKIMKVINNLGNDQEIESLSKEMCLFQRDGVSLDYSSRLKKTIKSRDVEVADLQRALLDAKKIRRAYFDRLLELGCSHQEIKQIKKKAKAGQD